MHTWDSQSGAVSWVNARWTYALIISPFLCEIHLSGQGEIAIVILPNVAVDHAMNENLPSNTINFWYDTIHPTPTLTTFAPSFTKKTEYIINVTFDEPVLNFTLADVSTGLSPLALDNFTAHNTVHYSFHATPLVCASVVHR